MQINPQINKKKARSSATWLMRAPIRSACLSHVRFILLIENIFQRHLIGG